MAAILYSFLLLVSSASASDLYSEVISDLTTSPVDSSNALRIKSERFWQGLLQAAQGMQMEEHMSLFADTEKTIADLPPANAYVREALSDALVRLRRADFSLLMQGAESTELASDGLALPVAGASGGFSFLSGQNVFAMAIRRFVGEGQYAENLHEQVRDRQARILPLLRSTASVTSSVLTDCHVAQQRAFDVLKYDLYNKDVPKTPKAAEDVANRLVDAASETRHRFTGFVSGTVNGIAEDHKGRDERASSTVLRSSLEASMLTLGSGRAHSGADWLIKV